MNVIQIGSDSEYVKIVLPDSYSTEGWAQTEVEIAVNGFHGSITPWLEAVDFECFTEELRALYETLQGKAEFSPREEQFTLKLVGSTGGHIQLTGEAWSQARYENRLTFELSLDQSYLLAPLRELETVVALGAKNVT